MAGILLMESDVLNVMLTLGLGFFAFGLLIISSWTTNVVNLYSIGLGLNSVFTRVTEWKLVIIAGVLGTAASTLNLLNSFTDFLFSLAIIFTPVAAIYVIDFFVLNKMRIYQIETLVKINNYNFSALTAWLFGVVATYVLNQNGISFTGVEAIDAFTVSSIVYWLLSQMRPRAN